MATNRKLLAGMLGVLALLVLSFSALAQEEAAGETATGEGEAAVQLPDAGTTPDSFIYGLDIAMEKMALAMTFDEGKKFEKRLEFAEERLAEARSMALEKKFEAMEKARVKYGDLLEGAQKDFVEVKNGDVEAELRKELELEQRFKQHRDKVKGMDRELKVKVRSEGELTAEQLEMISAILDSVKGQSGEVEIEIENEKGKTKIKIELETGEDPDEVEAAFKEQMGITEEEKQRALKEMDNVRGNLEGFFAEAGIATTPEHVQQIRTLIEQAQSKFASGNYEGAQELGESIRELMDDRVEEAVRKSLERRQDVRQETPQRAVAYRQEDWEDYWKGFEKLREEGLSEEKRAKIESTMERFRQGMESRGSRRESLPDGERTPSEEEQQQMRERFEESQRESSGTSGDGSSDSGESNSGSGISPEQFSDEDRARMEQEYNSGSGSSGGTGGSSNGGSSSGESGSSEDSGDGSYPGYEGNSG